MKKAILVFSVAVLVALPLVLGAAFVGAEGGMIKLDKPAEVFKGAKRTKAAVDFNHDKHVKESKIECVECHHKEDAVKLKAGDKPKSCVAADCHHAADQVVEGKKMLTTKDAFHKNCVKDCHKKQKKGPTKCVECHPGSAEEKE